MKRQIKRGSILILVFTILLNVNPLKVRGSEVVDQKTTVSEQTTLTAGAGTILENLLEWKNNYSTFQVNATKDTKTYMSYKAITSKTSLQYRLQSNYAYTGEYGIRQVNNRFCIALGSYFQATIGQYVDLILENGTTIQCIMADAKADVHTDENNIFTVANGCYSEFVVDTPILKEIIEEKGNVSYVNEEWRSPLKSVVVYNKNILTE